MKRNFTGLRIQIFVGVFISVLGFIASTLPPAIAQAVSTTPPVAQVADLVTTDLSILSTNVLSLSTAYQAKAQADQLTISTLQTNLATSASNAVYYSQQYTNSQNFINTYLPLYQAATNQAATNLAALNVLESQQATNQASQLALIAKMSNAVVTATQPITTGTTSP